MSLRRSDLLTTKIASFFNKSFKKPLKSILLASTTTNFRSAFSAFFRDNLIPFFSISSFDSLIPAVSEIITGYPSMFRWASTTSLVVPAISETIATSLFDKLFNKLDLPALVGPIIAILKPSRIISPTF